MTAESQKQRTTALKDAAGNQARLKQKWSPALLSSSEAPVGHLAKGKCSLQGPSFSVARKVSLELRGNKLIPSTAGQDASHFFRGVVNCFPSQLKQSLETYGRTV